MSRKTFDERLLPKSLKEKQRDLKLPADSMVETIIREAESQIRETLRRANRVAEKEKQLAERDVKETLDRARQEAATLAEKKRDHLQARMHIRKHLRIEGHKEELAERILDELLQRLKQIKRDDNYCRILARLLKDALEFLEGDSFEVMVSAPDWDFLSRQNRFDSMVFHTLKHRSGAASITLSEEHIETIGGLAVAQSPPAGGEAAVMFLNTFEEILYRHNDDLMVYLFEALMAEARAEMETA